jgi:superkiller protein 3
MRTRKEFILLKSIFVLLFIFLNGSLFAQQKVDSLSKRTADSLSTLGFDAFKAADYDKAISLFSKAIEFNKQDNELYYNLGSAYFGKGSLKESEDALRKSVALKGDFPLALVALADVIRMEKKPAEAFGLYEKALSIDNTIEKLHEKMGYMCMENKEYEKAIKYFEVPEKKKKLIEDGYYYLARCYEGLKNIPEAVKYYELFKKTPMNDPENRYNTSLNLGEIYFQQLKYDKALENYLTVVKENPNSPKIMEKIANIYQTKKDYDKAIAAFLKADNDYEKSEKYGVYLGLAQCYEAKNKYAEAASYYDNAASIKKTYAVYYNSGRLYRLQNNFDKAITNLNKALEIEPNNINAYKDLDLCYTAQKKYEDAIKVEKKMAEIQPAGADIFNAIGYSYLCLKDTVNALDYYKKALTVDPNYAKSLLSIANIYFTKKEWDNAIEYFEKLLKVNPQPEIKTNIAYACYNKGVAAFNAKNYDEAVKYYLKAVENKPDFKEVYSNLAKSYELLGNKAEAKKWQNKAKKGK